MKLIILNDYDQASEWAAKYIRNKILLFKPGADRYFTLGLPTGKWGTVQLCLYASECSAQMLCESV